MIRALVTGTLLRNPEERTSKNGNAYATATLKIAEGSGSAFVRVSAFADDARDELASLHGGDTVTVVGPLEVSTYERDGETRIGLSIMPDRLVSLRKERRQRGKAKPDASQAPGDRWAHHRRTVPVDTAPGALPDDAIPF
jgi:single-stranded DNA-binding protein